MIFLAVHCHACVDVFLQDARSAARAACPCPGCGAPATIVASTFYGWNEAIHFDELRHAIRQANLSAAEAANLSKSVKHIAANDAALRQGLRSLTRRIRSITLVRGVQTLDVARLHQATGMLLTILGALASTCGREASTTSPSWSHLVD